MLARSNAEEISRTSLPDDLDPCAIVVFEDVLRDHVKEIIEMGFEHINEKK